MPTTHSSAIAGIRRSAWLGALLAGALGLCAGTADARQGEPPYSLSRGAKLARVLPTAELAPVDAAVRRLEIDAAAAAGIGASTKRMAVADPRATTLTPRRDGVWDSLADGSQLWRAQVRVAVEIERTIKTPLRYSQIIPAALRDVKAGRYDRVQYLSPQGRADAVFRALHRVETVKVGGDSVRLTDQHWARFSFANLADWPTPGAQK